MTLYASKTCRLATLTATRPLSSSPSSRYILHRRERKKKCLSKNFSSQSPFLPPPKKVGRFIGGEGREITKDSWELDIIFFLLLLLPLFSRGLRYWQSGERGRTDVSFHQDNSACYEGPHPIKMEASFQFSFFFSSTKIH